VIALLQRVRRARVTVGAEVTGEIGPGLLVLVCAEAADTPAHGQRLLAKLLKLRVFADEAGKMNRSVQDVGGGLLIVSQFTLAADTTSGTRPSFSGAAPAALAQALYEDLLKSARAAHPEVACGRFGADMQVELVNDGPVTLPLTVR
jgi:D-aminoacyl-tRNA deacylase